MGTVAFHTLGCRLNQADSAMVGDDLARHGYTVVPYGAEPADVVVINSCSVTATASQKTRQAVRNARRRYPHAIVVVMGCDATVSTPAAFVDADILWPNPRRGALSEWLAEQLVAREKGAPRQLRVIAPTEPLEDFVCEGTGLFSEKTRANLKVQEGCDFHCTYCIVPQTRGCSRSRNLQDVLREARELIARGHREIVLSGVNVTTYENHGADLADLLEALLALGGDVRYRLGSAEPGRVIPKIVDLMAHSSRICRFLHLPLQYGDDAILQRMGRHYDTAQYRELVQEAHARIPGVCFGTDVIAGFPGETDDAFERCLKYIDDLPFGLMHVFTYSPRPDTPAATMAGRPTKHIAEQRAAALLSLAEKKAAAFAASQVGQSVRVLTESSEQATGWSDNYLSVHVTDETGEPCNDIGPNEWVEARIVETLGEREVRGVRLAFTGMT